MTKSALKLSAAQLEAVKRLLAGMEMVVFTPSSRYVFTKLGEGHGEDPAHFSLAVLNGLLKQGVAVLTKDQLSTKRYGLNPARREEIEAYVNSDAVRLAPLKLTSAQEYVVGYLYKGWVLSCDWHDRIFCIQEGEFKYGRKMSHAVPRATARALIEMGVVTFVEIRERRKWYRFEASKLAPAAVISAPA